MRPFFCQACGHRVFFENVFCLSCNRTLGFEPEELIMRALEDNGQGGFRPVGDAADHGTFRFCRNRDEHQACNWLVSEHDPDDYCRSCRLNRTVPDLGVAEHRTHWQKLEAAKRRLVYSLLRLRLPVQSKTEDAAQGLAFDFLADTGWEFGEGTKVMTGHLEGVITINIAEADDAIREKMRLNLREVYRTVLGHFRHESGHYYWDRLIRDAAGIEAVRSCFGDEREDYAAALERHYQQGPPANWSEEFVSSYAAAHPLEDWAETWAHYLHIVDTLETAACLGVMIREPDGERSLADPIGRSMSAILDDWHALRMVLNSLNRSMGLQDAYPFVISQCIEKKLAVIHDRIGQAGRM